VRFAGVTHPEGVVPAATVSLAGVASLRDLYARATTALRAPVREFVAHNGELVTDLGPAAASSALPSASPAAGAASPSELQLYLVFDAVVLGGADVGGLHDFGARLAAAEAFLGARGCLRGASNLFAFPSPRGGGGGDDWGAGSNGSGGAGLLGVEVKAFVPARSLGSLAARLEPLPGKADLHGGALFRDPCSGRLTRNDGLVIPTGKDVIATEALSITSL